jgi:radical SAM enzyme (TIGR01210 family)
LKNNYILSAINKKIKNQREKLQESDIFYPRIEKIVDGYYLELWFSTKGCSFDKSGSCTMCNYGIGHNVDKNLIIKSLKDYLNNLKIDISELMISPSGSLWDKNEVEEDLLEDIYNIANNFSSKIFMIETRVDTITPKRLDKFRNSVKNKELIIEVGLESSNQWILDFAINKKMDLKDFKEKVALIKSYEVKTYANISIGHAFLNEFESIKTTVEAINFAFDSKVDKVVLFPIHIKPNTFINWLYQNNFYNTISLWSLVEVLNRVDNKLLKNIEIAWYKSYYEDDSKMVSSPTTCPKCYNQVVSLLDEYRATCSYNTIEKLNRFDCSCKTKWKNLLNKEDDNLIDRTIGIYKIATKKILDSDLDDEFIQIMRDEYVANF